MQKMFGYKWSSFSTFTLFKTMKEHKNPKMQKFLEYQDFFRISKIFGQNWKKLTIIIFPRKLKFPKLPTIFGASLKIFFQIFWSIKSFWFHKIFSPTNVPKIIKKHEKSQTIQFFLTSQKTFFKLFLKCPIFE